jgi:hypothetical protein
MADFDDMVKDVVRWALGVEVECDIDDDGDYRVRVRLTWDGKEMSVREDYFDRTGAKELGKP